MMTKQVDRWCIARNTQALAHGDERTGDGLSPPPVMLLNHLLRVDRAIVVSVDRVGEHRQKSYALSSKCRTNRALIRCRLILRDDDMGLSEFVI